MPVPTETLRNTRTVSIIFGISSLALLASLVWMIKVDYARPWRDFQDDFADLQVSLARFDVLATQTRSSLESLAQAQGAVAAARKQMEAQQAEARRIAAALSGPDSAQWAEAAGSIARQVNGPYRAAFEARARGIGEAFAVVISQQAAKADPGVMADRVRGDALFREQLVRLIEWFDVQKLQARADAIRGDDARADLEFKGIKGDLNVASGAYEHEKGLYGEEDHRTKEALALLKQVRDRHDRARVRLDQLADERKGIEDQQKLLRSEITSAERALARIEKERGDAEKKYAEYAGTVRRGVFNMPLMDFASPKGTRGRHEIRQAVLPDVHVELNFVKGYQTDRCMTCHVAIADPDFSKENLVARLERAVFSINEQLEREGRPQRLETPRVPAETESGEGGDDSSSVRQPRPGDIARAWYGLTPDQQDTIFAALRDEVNKYQRLKGEKELNFAQPLLAHSNMDLFVSPDSPHPFSRMGCTSCHEGNGEETDFVLAAHTPRDKRQRHEWEQKYYIRTAGLVPEQDFETAEHHWTRPMLLTKYSEAGCSKCHPKAADIAMHDGRPAAPRINEGRFLFTSLGCINCHLVEELAEARKVGPDLSHLAEKVTRGFAENWIFFPHDYRPSTNMPHYFLQENNDAKAETAGGDADPVLRTKTEVVAMSEYLFAVSDGYAREPLPEDLWESLKDEESDAVKAAADRGRRVFGSVGCLACHSNLAYQPDDENGAAGIPLGQQWIVPDMEGKLQALARSTQLAKARYLKAVALRDARKAGENPAAVALGEEIKERLAIDVEESGAGIALPMLLDAFNGAFGSSGYDVFAARRAAFRKVFDPLKLKADEVRGVSLAEEEQALAELSEEAATAIGEAAAARYGEMTYVDRVNYAMRHFDNAYETLFNPAAASASGPVFTRFAPELSSVRTKFADYGRAVGWLYDWLKNPRHYSSYTKMPGLRLKRGEFPVVNLETGEVTGERTPADEALDIAVYLATLNENTEFAEKSAKRLPEQEGEDPKAYAAKRDELLGALLGGLNSAARTDAILRDEGGELSERLVAKLIRSLGEDGARKRIASMDLERRRWMFLGDKMIGHYGCYACHQVRGYENAARPGTELTAWGQKQLTQLDFAFFEPEFRELREKEPEEKQDPLFKNLYPFDPKHPEDRARLIDCAWTNPPEEVEHTLASFAWHKLRNPRIWDRRKLKAPYDKLKMPNFFLNDEQADALVTFLLSRKPAQLGPSLRVDYQGTPEGRVADGRNLATELNCVACHKIDGNGAVMHQFITRSEGDETQFDEVNGPPWLRGEGAKVQPDWFYGFLNNVQMLRPWLKVRMPSFHLDNRQATALVDYFAGLSEKEAEWLEQHLGPARKYISEEQKRSGTASVLASDTGPGSGEASVFPAGDRPPGAAGDEPTAGSADAAGEGRDSEEQAGEEKTDTLPPGADWYEQAGLLKTADALRRYALDNRLVRRAAIDPARSTPAAVAAAHAGMIRDAAFLRQLFDVPYPFTERGEPGAEELAADGETVFYELKCMACHVFGDPTVPGANRQPTAPNLQLTHARLQSEWVRRWLESPSRIQPGTKMPSLFGMDGQDSAFKQYGPADREKLLARLQDKNLIDDPVKQRAALTAFLYDAGEKRLNKIQPAEGGGAATRPADNPEPPNGEATQSAQEQPPAGAPSGAESRPAATRPTS